MAEFALHHARKAMSQLDTHTYIAYLSRIVSCVVQIIYAINEEYFITDKGAVKACANFKILPEYFEERVDEIFFKPDSSSIYYCEMFIRELSPYMR